MVLGLAGLYFFLIFFNIAGEFLVNVAGFVIPGYYSLDALFSATKVDDTQWLTVCTPPRYLKPAPPTTHVIASRQLTRLFSTG